MATVPERLHESPVGAVRGLWVALCDRLEQVSPLLVVAAYVVVYAVSVVGAAIGALYLGAVIPGVAGGVVFLTVGLVILAAAPTAVRRLFVRVMEATEPSSDS